MGEFIQILLFVITGVLLLWLGYMLFFRSGKKKQRLLKSGAPDQKRKPETPASSGASQFCPVCSAALAEGELVNSAAFPSSNGRDRLMHIRGCRYCLSGERERVCPVCGAVLNPGEILIARMFERPGRRHVHVLGCSRCRG